MGISNVSEHIVILDDWEQALARLLPKEYLRSKAKLSIYHHHLEGDALATALRPATILILTRERCAMPNTLLDQCAGLRHIIFTGQRNSLLDVEHAKSRGITVSNTGGGPGKASTCELTWALILNACKRLAERRLGRNQRAWRSDEAEVLPPILSGKTLGLIGLGEIGQRVAAVGQAFGMRTLTWSPNMTAARAEPHGVLAVSLEELLSQSDVVSLHLVPSAATHKLMNAERLALMKPDSLLVNTSRAALVDEQALLEALQQGRPGLAALDVYMAEPIDDTHPLLQQPNAWLSPHLGFVVEPVFSQFAHDLSESLRAIFEGKPVPRKL